MATKPTTSPAILRQLVRQVLALAPGYGFTDEHLCRAVRDLLPVNAATDGEIEEAAVWNLEKDYVRNRVNEDTEEREWLITQHGIAKEETK
jgi:hypothetical protein